jgi:hypothetical protein
MNVLLPKMTAGQVVRGLVVQSALTARDCLRRKWIEHTMPEHESDLSPDEWDARYWRYKDAGGSAEVYEALIDRYVLED